MYKRLAFVLAASLVAGCSGGSGSSSIAPGDANGVSPASAATVAIAAMDSFGSAVGTVDSYNETTEPPTDPTGGDVRPLTAGQSGTCKNYHEFFAPDRHGDPNSTETLTFYDSTCTQLARDAVRIWTSTGTGSETINRSVSFYAIGGSTPIAQVTATRKVENATFGQYGAPLSADGFDSSSTGQLSIAGANTITSGSEMVMLPISGNTNDFCGDSAGYNVNGIPPSNEVFGWQGGVLTGGTRTKNSDGSITWTSTRTGTANEGKPKSFSIHSGTENTQCPITVPMWTLSGGTLVGSFTIPTTVTYRHGFIENLSIQNAVLATGATLNVSTNVSQQFTSSTFITGTISMGSTTIATFGVNTFGNGTLTLSSNGKQYTITDWQVVK